MHLPAHRKYIALIHRPKVPITSLVKSLIELQTAPVHRWPRVWFASDLCRFEDLAENPKIVQDSSFEVFWSRKKTFLGRWNLTRSKVCSPTCSPTHHSLCLMNSVLIAVPVKSKNQTEIVTGYIRNRSPADRLNWAWQVSRLLGERKKCVFSFSAFECSITVLSAHPSQL